MKTTKEQLQELSTREILSYSDWMEAFGVTYRPKSSLRWGGDVKRSQAVRARNARKAEAGNGPGYLAYLRANLGKLPVSVETLQSAAFSMPRAEAEEWLARYGYRKGCLGWVRPEGMQANSVFPPLSAPVDPYASRSVDDAGELLCNA